MGTNLGIHGKTLFIALLIIFANIQIFSINASNGKNYRSFYMGFTDWPYSFGKAAREKTYDYIEENADLICFHFDNGIPWSEALEENYSQNLLNEIDYKLEHIPDEFKVYVSTTPLAHDRKNLAPYWGGKNLPEYWENKDFDDPDVMVAYTNWCRFLINRFHPDYFAYGIEVNANFKPDGKKFLKFLELAEYTYSHLKQEYPNLPIFLTFQTGSFELTKEEQMKATKILLNYSDLIGISTYPFAIYYRDEWNIYGNPEKIPDNWLQEFIELAPEKPLAITETGYIAQPLHIWKYNIHIDGKESWQAKYVDMLLQKLDEYDAEFVIWFTIRDYDIGWIILRLFFFVDPFYKYWKDTGLIDGFGKEREGLKVWREWLSLPNRKIAESQNGRRDKICI